ncbi:hypothetical protein M413DRAFT_446918 [Hebeloma cylindrosporum]|uniref:F-box domain-containing protein n=1 Tax=Hebeloma cylindrosporum TaxID=76867 RepID=A0A0C2YG02_HEBCY|nr:hypothetical protein M413DRAFT_446918 [Hebeloma cylindrosporum h7]
MAPRTRSNRIEILAREKLLASGQIFNTTGFAALPDELYLEIISHFPAYPIPCGDKAVNIQAVRDRHFTLFALSQTCRSLRPAFLRYLWQRIEVYDGMKTGNGILYRRFGRHRAHSSKKYAEELVRQLEIVTVREPSLARHVNFMNVVVTDYSVDTVLVELARCMALFPNLHTVQFEFAFWPRPDIPNPFMEYQYPSIKKAYVCTTSTMVLSACPEARIVSPMKWKELIWWPRSMFASALRSCPALEILGPFLLEKDDIKGIAEGLPNLREISLSALLLRTGLEFMSGISALGHLRIINILTNPYRFGKWYDVTEPAVAVHEVREWVQWAKEILSRRAQDSEDDRGPRKVVVHYEKRAPDTHLVDFHKN